jgi:hypothetical protein
MTFEELEELVQTIRYEPGYDETRFGCECGCGGDSWTEEDWDRGVEEAKEARKALKKIGITFDE